MGYPRGCVALPCNQPYEEVLYSEISYRGRLGCRSYLCFREPVWGLMQGFVYY